jgi:hypothetical protein
LIPSIRRSPETAGELDTDLIGFGNAEAGQRVGFAVPVAELAVEAEGLLMVLTGLLPP